MQSSDSAAIETVPPAVLAPASPSNFTAEASKPLRSAASEFQEQLAGTRRLSQIYTDATGADLRQLRRATVEQPKPVQAAILQPIDDFREAQLDAQAVVEDVTTSMSAVAKSVVAEEAALLKENKESEDQLARELKAEYDLLVEAEIEARAIIAENLPDEWMELELELEERARNTEERERQLRDALSEEDLADMTEEEKQTYKEIALRAWAADIDQASEERLLLREIAKRNETAQLQEFAEQRQTEALIALRAIQVQMAELEARTSTESEVEKKAAMSLLKEARERAALELEIAERNKQAAAITFEEKVQQQAIITGMMKIKASAIVTQSRTAPPPSVNLNTPSKRGLSVRRRSSQVVPVPDDNSAHDRPITYPSSPSSPSHNSSFSAWVASSSSSSSSSSCSSPYVVLPSAPTASSPTNAGTPRLASPLKAKPVYMRDEVDARMKAFNVDKGAQIKDSRGKRLLAVLRGRRPSATPAEISAASSSSTTAQIHARNFSSTEVQLHLLPEDATLTLQPLRLTEEKI